jgi:hyperosmotically inducible periplasmic protein
MLKTGMLLLALVLLPAAGWAFPTPWGTVYGVARDERNVVDMATDKAATTEIKAKIMDRDRMKGLAVKVYCFVGQVALLGQLDDEDFQEFAVATAHAANGVKGVTTYWEPVTQESTLAADVEITARIRAALVADKQLSSTQMELEVFAGKVYLLGMVRSRQDVDRAVAHAKTVAGVIEVVSLMVPTKL